MLKCIRCKDHALTGSYSCGPGFSFSMVVQGCMASSEVTCIEAHCATTGNGFYIIPGTGCRAYYSCNQGKRTDYLCPLATTYDRSKQVRGTMLQLERGNLQTPVFINLFMVYFTMLSTAQLSVNELENMWKVGSWPYLKYCHDTSLETMRKTTRKLSQDTPYLS